ncbi:type II toxin-antitoxin system VapB family antitoxin [Spongisporangium articulatum]|uniref:Type II toxin-antitoxin system VapB family antitoxin n=1 Tax=Spongisporangium articulatum TaxID=3362603 RepID=A0ABW8AQH6_9ACTN
MRTTMNLPDSLMAQVKQRASSEGRTVTSVVEAALRSYLEEYVARAEGLADLPVAGDPGDRPLVDLEDQDLLKHYAYSEGDERHLQ